ncbi:MAG: hypothetical protein OEU09_12460 [Rhodospirillales bacterium]|nr:hypothetical protein [Rhodospirillales bacterium]MDH3912098.1 hypothetical protein [Rhodospirillales bacterium]
MAYRRALGWFAVAVALVIWSGGASGSSDVVEKVQTHLYAGKTVEAATAARERLTDAPGDGQARFALGAVQFMQAVEHLGQALHRYGLRKPERQLGLGLAELPILRIPVPENPRPYKLTYEKLRGVLKVFVRDLETAEATLGSIEDQTIDLPLNIGLIRLDLNEDGRASDEEALWQIFRVVANAGWLDEHAASQLLTDFDASDAPWLQAYCHLLMAIAEFLLAYDWRLAFETSFHGLFPKLDLPSSELEKKSVEARANLRELGNPQFNPHHLPLGVWMQSPEYEVWKKAHKFYDHLEWVSIADLIAFVHLNHWPVIEPNRMKNVLEHLEKMVRLSRENWRRITAETDDRNEWIPNPRQSGALPRMQITPDMVMGWQRFLDEFEALLQGEKLVPHWRFDQGMNLRRIFLEPTTFDIVLLIQGSAAIHYLEDGEISTGETWNQITHLFGGDFFRYFVWFN